MDADRAALAEENAALKAELAVARAKASEDAALIVQQTLRIAKLERQPDPEQFWDAKADWFVDDGKIRVAIKADSSKAGVPIDDAVLGLKAARAAWHIDPQTADAAGQVMFYGRGAGGMPTASAVLGDVITGSDLGALGMMAPAAREA